MRSIINLGREGSRTPSKKRIPLFSEETGSSSNLNILLKGSDQSLSGISSSSGNYDFVKGAQPSVPRFKDEDAEKQEQDDNSPILLSRRSEHTDASTILKLLRVPQTTDLFGDFVVHEIIEMAYYSLSQVNEAGRVVSHIALFDYPNVPCVPPTNWLMWFKRLYKLERATVRNTLFIHLLVWNIRYSHEFLKFMLDTIFINNPYLQHLVIVVPPGAATFDILEEYFQRLWPFEFFGSDDKASYDLKKHQSILLCMREPHAPRLKIRRAAEEDNDDIVPILHDLAGNLTSLYGQYYIAEMVAYPNEKRQLIVAEKNEMAIGIMCMNTDVNYETLNEQYELAPFYGLRKWDEKDHIVMPDTHRVDSREGINLPMVIQSNESLSKLSQLSTLYEGMSGTLPSTTKLQDSIDDIDLELQVTASSESEDDVVILPGILSASSIFLSQYYGEDLGTSKLSLSSESPQLPNATELASRIRQISINDIPNTNGVSTLLLGRPEKVFMKIPIYYGAPNAFAVELFALRDDQDERYAFDFLEAAFECFPDMQYCIMLLPAADPVFSLLGHFTRVSPRPNRSNSRELYVVHRNAVISELQVRPGTRIDQSMIQLLLSRIDKREAIQVDFHSSVNYEDSIYRSYVMTSEGTVVGLAIVSIETDLEYLQSNYDIEVYTQLDLHKPDHHGILKHFVLSPIFHRHSRYFLKEIHRLSGLSSLYYALYCHNPVDLDKYVGMSLVTCVGDLLPITPRRQIEYHLSSLGENCPHDNVLRREIPFAMFHISQKFTSLPKTDINTRIIVVGASDTALAFLEALLFTQASAYLSFNNITLVAPHGLPGDSHPYLAREKLLPYLGRYNTNYLARINFRTYVNLIYGIMSGINRNNKYIVVNNESVLHYDYLLLFCGEQFQNPLKVKVNVKGMTDLTQCQHHIREMAEDSEEFPINIFRINTELDAANALAALKRFKVQSQEYPVIIYGSCIRAFCCVSALLEFGIPGSMITFVECFPHDPHSVSYFNDSEVDEAVIGAIQAEGVKWYTAYYFSDWQHDPLSNRIVKVTFESKTKTITLECIAMFCYGNKSICTKTFQALSHAALVYDGRLVINANFQTSDPTILAAGPMTKYRRAYYADNMRHGHYSSVEIGTAVGEMFRRKLDPYVHEPEEDVELERDRSDSNQPTSRLGNMLTPLFTKPLIISCCLTGGFNYLHVRRPGPVAPLEADMSREDYGQVLVTSNWKNREDPRYFRLHLNGYNTVETITCYTRQEMDVENLITLYGKHERLLNNLIARFDLGYITDLYEFFREPWACAIYHDRFPMLMNMCRVDLLTSYHLPGTPIINDILEQFSANNWLKLSKEAKEPIEQKYSEMGYKRLVEKLLTHFIDYNPNHLPMYATPKVVHRILKGAEDSPLMVPKSN